MFHHILKANPKGDTLCTVDANGKVSNEALHDELLAIDDQSEAELRKESYTAAKKLGASEDALSLLK